MQTQILLKSLLDWTYSNVHHTTMWWTVNISSIPIFYFCFFPEKKPKTEHKGAVTSTSHYTALQLIGTNWRFFLRNRSLNKSRLSSCWKKAIKSILAASATKCWMWWGVMSACKFGNIQTGALMSGDMIHPCGELGEAWAHLSKTTNGVIVHSCYF